MTNVAVQMTGVDALMGRERWINQPLRGSFRRSPCSQPGIDFIYLLVVVW